MEPAQKQLHSLSADSNPATDTTTVPVVPNAYVQALWEGPFSSHRKADKAISSSSGHEWDLQSHSFFTIFGV